MTVQKTAGVLYNSQYVTSGMFTYSVTDLGNAIFYTYQLNTGNSIAPGTLVTASSEYRGNGTLESTAADTFAVAGNDRRPGAIRHWDIC